MSSEGRPAWWVVGDGRVLAGPFADEYGAAGAALPSGETWEHLDVEYVFGVRRVDGTVARHPRAEDEAFEAHLAEQLDRLRDDHKRPVSGHPLEKLTRQVATALLEAGFDLHNCAGSSPLGGVCVMPTCGRYEHDGVLIAWTQHDRMTVENVRGDDVSCDVQDTMDAAVADVLTQMGFTVGRVVKINAHIVTGGPSERP